MIYSLYFVSHNLFGRRLKKKKKKERLNVVFINQMIFWKKHFRFSKFLLDSKSNQTYKYYILGHLDCQALYF